MYNKMQEYINRENREILTFGGYNINKIISEEFRRFLVYGERLGHDLIMTYISKIYRIYDSSTVVIQGEANRSFFDDLTTDYISDKVMEEIVEIVEIFNYMLERYQESISEEWLIENMDRKEYQHILFGSNGIHKWKREWSDLMKLIMEMKI